MRARDNFHTNVALQSGSLPPTPNHAPRDLCVPFAAPTPALCVLSPGVLRLLLMLALSLPCSACRRSPLPNFGTESNTGNGDSSGGDSSGTSSEETDFTTSTNSTGGATASGSTSADDSTTTNTPICGDGIVDIGETCDDGNIVNTDDCLDTCAWASCGDMQVHQDVEFCDDGNSNQNDDCLNNCSWAHCGDTFKREGIEDCDDGNLINGDGCSSECKDEYTVFISSNTYTGDLEWESFPNLEGLARADAICNKLADSAGLKGEFKAWLSDTSEAPSTRLGLNDFTGNFVLPNGNRIASGWQDLTDGSLLQPIRFDQNGGVQNGEVWTHTNAQGKPTTNNQQYSCLDWSTSSSQYNGYYGRSDQKTTQWTHYNYAQCDVQSHIYCIQVLLPEE